MKTIHSIVTDIHASMEKKPKRQYKAVKMSGNSPVRKSRRIRGLNSGTKQGKCRR